MKKELNQMIAGEKFTFEEKGLKYGLINLDGLITYRTCNGKTFKCISDSQFIEMNGNKEYGDIINCFISGRGENKKIYYELIEVITEKTDTYQFKTRVGGWHEGKKIGVLISDITHAQSITIGYGLSVIMKREIRTAKVTGYENLQARNDRGETLGNGSYLHYNNAKRYFSSNQ
jgi:hypothetical protein